MIRISWLSQKVRRACFSTSADGRLVGARRFDSGNKGGWSPRCGAIVRNFFNTITSKAYWQFVLFSRTGAASVFAIFGGIYLVVEVLDFFKIYTRDEYGSWAFLVFLGVAIIGSIVLRPPTKSVVVNMPGGDGSIEVRVADIFDVSGAVMVSTNTNFEADVAGGKIAPDSLQGQFTGKYFTGNQTELIEQIDEGKEALEGEVPYPIGTTIPVTTHGKAFYFTAMANLNEQGNASTTREYVKRALDGLWRHVRESGELQELAVPVIGTGRGRLRISRKTMIGVIADSFEKASEEGKITDRLIIVIPPSDAERFGVNLYDIKDYLNHLLHS